MSVPNNVWNIVAQTSHVLGGMCLVAYTILIFNPHALWYSVPIFIAVAAVKEFWFDENYETPDERGSSLVDFIFYNVGLLMGLITAWLAGWV